MTEADTFPLPTPETQSDARVYLQWMEPAAIKAVARRYTAQGDAGEAGFALLAALGKEQRQGRQDPETWADLGVTLYDTGRKKQGLAALLHAIEGGIARTETVASALLVARELGFEDHAKAMILRRLPIQLLQRIEQALIAVRLSPPITVKPDATVASYRGGA
jgi:hypothetical protein